MKTRLHYLVDLFRHALDKLDWQQMPIGFHNFPLGTCGEISDILANYLQSRGIQEIEYVCGMLPDGRTHAWLEVAGYVVDITADQFPDLSQSVIVINASPWHEKLTLQKRRNAGFIIRHDQPITGHLHRVYSAALDALELLSLPVDYD